MVDKCLVPGTPPLTQKLLIAWGKDDEQSISSDVWLLEINGHDCGSIKWKMVCNYTEDPQYIGTSCSYPNFHLTELQK